MRRPAILDGAYWLKLEVKTHHDGGSRHIVKPSIVASTLHAVSVWRVKYIVYGHKYLAFFNMHIVVAEDVVEPGVKYIDVGQTVFFRQVGGIAGRRCRRSWYTTAFVSARLTLIASRDTGH